VDEWRKNNTVPYLGIPEYIGSGSHTNSGAQYRFMVMQRFGTDLEKIFNDCGRQFSLPTVCCLALRVVSVLCRRFVIVLIPRAAGITRIPTQPRLCSC